MKHTMKLLAFLCLITVSISCSQKQHTKISESNKIEIIQSKFAQFYPEFNTAILKEHLQRKTESDSILRPFYSAYEYNPIWLKDTLEIKSLKELISVLDNAHEHGLSSETFQKKAILSITDSVDAGLFSGNMEELYNRISDLEIISTKAVINYITGMNYGFLDPLELYDKESYSIKTLKPDSTFRSDLYRNIKEDAISSIINSHPTDSIYTKMVEAYRNLETKKDIEFTKIENIANNKGYKIGDKDKNIAAIVNRLIITGEYTPNLSNNDTLNMELNESLLDAVNKFRVQNSYPKENEIGNLTIAALNRPLEYYQKRLQANMERYRWKKVRPQHDKHIEVNIASFLLIASQTDSLPLIMNVCVGSPKTKTPTLESNIGYINLNPVWNVPSSISKNEIVISQKKDHTYIPRHNMRLYKDGKEVDVTSIDWQQIDPSRFNYIIRQESGNANSLGRLKFMFNNPFSVYLHDTPVKHAFSYKNRAISHGCVRVQKPIELAFFCTSPNSELYKDRLYHSIDKSPISKEGKKLLAEEKLKKIPDIINMKDKISLSIDYYTVYMLPNSDRLYYADDVYKYDDIILKALNL